MSAFKFIHSDSELTVTVETDAITWPDITEAFYQFLLGCGFNISREQWENLSAD